MGTRLRGDIAPPSRSDPAPARLPPADLTPDDDRLSAPWRPGVATAASSPFVGGCDGAVDRRPAVTRSTQTDSDRPLDLEASYRVCADVMYTNRANLRHTIAVQQRLFRQQLAALPRPSGGRRPADTGTTTGKAKPGANMEWIVRKRSDGSRYVTRRPVRSRRSATWVGDATTTDDDDVEQPKTGRYWTRDQRRQHVAERRQREAMKRAAACRSPPGRPQHDLAEELAAIGRHRQTPLLSVATV